MKRGLLIILTLLYLTDLSAAVWQWSVEVKGFVSPETNSHPRAFLWVPENCTRVQAIVVGQHNMCEETIFEHPFFRKTMAELGFAIIWITPGIDQQWNVQNGCQQHFDAMLNDLAEVSGYSEIKDAPIVPLGHSAMATFPWNFAAWNPERTLAIISYHGDAPRTNLTGYGRENLEWGRTRNIDGIPGLMIQGEYEWWEARVNPALAFRMMYPKSCISFLCDAGHGHFDVSDEVVSYISLFLKKAAQYRLSDNQQTLKKVDINKGWLAERWHPEQKNRAKTASFNEYIGNSHDAFWYFDQEIAEATEMYYSRSRERVSQYIGFANKGKLYPYNEKSHVKYNVKFEPLEDGVTFHLSALFTDSLHSKITHDHSLKGDIQIDRICGPVQKINDTTFTVHFYRMGLNNSKRTSDISLIAHHEGDERYKSAVQELNIRIPYPNVEGTEQNITFNALNNIGRQIKMVQLKATSDKGLPVYYYVKEGPAEIIGNKLVIKPIPPRTKYPIKITVVAWQYGINNDSQKIQTAKAIKQSFYIK